MDETRFDLTAHQPIAQEPTEHQPADHQPADHHRTGTSRRGLVALTVVIGLLALVGGVVVGASLSESSSGGADVAVASEPTTITGTAGADLDESEPAESTEDTTTGADPVEDPTPTTQPDDPESDPTPDPDDDDGEEGGVVVTKIPPGLFVPSIGFDEVIDMGAASSAEWTLTNTGLGDANWSISGGVGLTFYSPDNDWFIVPAGTLEPGESITITVGLYDSPGTGAWSKGFALNHPGGQTEIAVTGNKPLLILPES